MEQRFSTDEVAALTGMTPRQLQWWDECGIVRPARVGHRRIYSLDDLAEVAVIGELRARGFSLQRVRKVMCFLQHEFGQRLVETVSSASQYHLLTDGKRIYLETSPQQVLDILKSSHQPMFAICLSDTVRLVRAEISGNSLSSKLNVNAAVAGKENTVPKASRVRGVASSRPRQQRKAS